MLLILTCKNSIKSGVLSISMYSHVPFRSFESPVMLQSKSAVSAFPTTMASSKFHRVVASSAMARMSQVLSQAAHPSSTTTAAAESRATAASVMALRKVVEVEELLPNVLNIVCQLSNP